MTFDNEWIRGKVIFPCLKSFIEGFPVSYDKYPNKSSLIWNACPTNNPNSSINMIFFSDAFDDIAPILQQEENKLAVFSLIILKYVLSSISKLFDFFNWVISPSLIFFTALDKTPKNLKSLFSTESSNPLESK